MSDWYIMKNGKPIGTVSADGADAIEALKENLKDKGYTVTEVAEAEEVGYSLSEECVDGQERACELHVALVVAEAIGVEAGANVDEVQHTLRKNHATEHDVYHAIHKLRDQLPDTKRHQVTVLMEEANLHGHGRD